MIFKAIVGFVIKCSFVFANQYDANIKPIFDTRCIACHSCLNAPCQINLQSYDGFLRGGNHLNVYDGLRSEAVAPTRMGIDAQSPEEWRKKGFFSINTSSIPEKNVFYNILDHTPTNNRVYPKEQVADVSYCPESTTVQNIFFLKNDKLKMPYALPTLEENELLQLKSWIEKGAKGPEVKISRSTISKSDLKEIQGIESFFNGDSDKEKLVARFLYEHLFLAHIYLHNDAKSFFELVRSSTACSQKITIIPTRRPNDNPGFSKFYYCLRPLKSTIVAKTHMPFELSIKKIEHLKKLFGGQDWIVTKVSDYENSTAANPLIAFSDIPVSIRYRFLLENAHYIVSTFIKGPVCNGSNALNSIQEQFFVFFMDPKFDLMVTEKEWGIEAKNLILLPGMWGSDLKISDTLKANSVIIKNKDAYLKRKASYMEKQFPLGLLPEHLWNGDGDNPNAVLTIFRHDDNAFVSTGIKGDLSKTVFVFDYSILERMVYNLVVNFDVYGNIGHQTITRLYMDVLRMEAEDMYLTFFNPEERLRLKKKWYKGSMITEAKFKYYDTMFAPNVPAALFFGPKNDSQKELLEQIIFKEFPSNVVGDYDLINWKKITIPKSNPHKENSDILELRKMASLNESEGGDFSKYFPDVSYLLIKDGLKNSLYTIIHHREHENISWILAESLRMAEEEDTLSVLNGFYGVYPNIFFSIEKSQLPAFVEKVQAIRSDRHFKDLINQFGVRRRDPKFWSTYDMINALYRETEPLFAGVIDLTRYMMVE